MKQFSSKRSIQILAHLLKEYGIYDIVISPGSRNAPLAIHFSEMDELNCYSIVDERSAAFVAMGMAKSNQGSIASAPIMEIKSGSLVKVIANNGKAVLPKPSAKLVKIFAVQSRLNAIAEDICRSLVCKHS